MPAFSRLAVAVQLVAVFVSPVLGAAYNQQYDYVIVGGGVTGLIVANRLSEDSRKTVLVIEAGDNVDTPSTKIPWKANDLTSANGLIWENYTSVAEPGLGNGSFPVIAAKVLGGGSVINGMVYDRGAAADYDAWEALGNKGWGWEGMEPYFIKGTTFQPPSEKTIRDFNITFDPSTYGHGPLTVSITSTQYQDIKAYWAAWKASGVHVPVDGNAGEAYGVSWYPNTMDATTGRRAHARYAYYDPIQRRRNLHIITGATAKRVILDDRPKPMAQGVEVTDKTGKTTCFYAKKEVILAAGAIQTPKILQLSGVGPRAVLQAAGIKTRVELDSVGANFQDHPYATAIFNTTSNFFPNLQSLNTNATFNASAWKEYEQYKTGPYTYARGNALAFIPLSDTTNNTQALIDMVNGQKATDFLPSIYKKNSKLAAGYAKQRKVLANLLARKDAAATEMTLAADGSYALIGIEKPLSRGSITINAKNPNGAPDVAFNAFVNPVDRLIMSIGLRFFRSVWARPELKSYKISETVPGAQFKTDKEIFDALLKQSMLQPSLVHPAGTCSMMAEKDGGCVSDKLLVYGTQHLSVVDASIIPLIPSCHLQATMYGIGEKAADIIKAR
ncbi:GMC oxidoreductase [Bipolaris victoriae FI3]|uniref:GMC oxidoreductase n=2 Tax=Bipolaris TaxID=33194 RepID=W6YRL3_COCC2|nr:GMC oxidoreductase [Bipolaris zeicola 26-R-13]XP_014562660.1 GMC oxidoreductase [Bipolaris victoriae FI3]EUC34141.1 GMC oxidoreductase [Bipolaris zeicola 26-R-13]